MFRISIFRLWNQMRRLAGYASIGKIIRIRTSCFSNAADRRELEDKSMEELRVILRDSSDYTQALQSCINRKCLVEGTAIHTHMIKAGFGLDVFLQNYLVNFYAKCGSLFDACQMFDKMSERNVISWNALIAGHVQHGHPAEAQKLFCKMQLSSMKANEFTLGSILRACASLGDIEQGKCIHVRTMKNGFERDVVVGSALVDMYTKSGSIVDARQVFDEMPERNSVTWTAMIAGYAQEGYGQEALHLFQMMREDGVSSTYMTFASVLSACARIDDLEQVHCHTIKTGFEWDVSVGNALITMYAKCGSMDKANKLFEKMLVKDVVSWNAVIAAYAQNGHGDKSLSLFLRSQQVGVKSNEFTLGSVLRACGSVAALEQGKQIHAHIIENWFGLDILVGSALVDMYAKCGSIKDSQRVFNELPERNVISWNAMLAGYVQYGLGIEAFQLLGKMQKTGLKANAVTFASVLSAFINPEFLQQGRQVHVCLIKTSFVLDVLVGNALLTMYAKCGNIEDASKTFVEMPERDVVSWNAMIAACVQIGHGEEALKLFCKLQIAGMKPDQFTFASVLRVCASLANLEQGKQVHSQIIKMTSVSDMTVENALVTMYSKCGTIDDALKLFDAMICRDIISWNAMIAGYAQHGRCLESINLFEQMQSRCIKPNEISFVGVLSACSHAGLVDEGWHYYSSMRLDHGIVPGVEHYACMVDLLGRAGQLDKAENLMNDMPFGPNAFVCRTLLGACRVHGNLAVGKRVAECLIELDPQDAATYVTLSNIYAAAGRWETATKVRKMMKDRGVRKDPGFSWIEVKSRVHAFVVGDQTHSQTEEIYAELERLTGQMVEAGYLPDTNFALHDMQQDDKGILSQPP